jgi:hypothetical protein
MASRLEIDLDGEPICSMPPSFITTMRSAMRGLPPGRG